MFAFLEATALAQYLKTARWGYAAINTAHIFGIALLIGGILPLNLRLLGVLQGLLREDALTRLLRPCAAFGLLLAMISGGMMFSVDPDNYAALPVFQIKMGFILIGTLSALYGSRESPMRRPRFHAVISLLCWPLALVSGRLIAFVS